MATNLGTEKKIKLLTTWRLRNERRTEDKINDYLISHGIWEIIGFENLDTINPIARFRCIMPCHKDLKQFDERKIPFSVIRIMCEEVMIISVDDDLKDIIRYKKLQRITE